MVVRGSACRADQREVVDVGGQPRGGDQGFELLARMCGRSGCLLLGVLAPLHERFHFLTASSATRQRQHHACESGLQGDHAVGLS
jgi:hypothetical protein